MSFVSFYELNESEVLSTSSLLPGSIICCKDSTNVYMVPTTGGSPVKMAETIRFLTESERSNILAPINGKQYFCYDTEKMWIYYNKWIYIGDLTNEIINGVIENITHDTITKIRDYGLYQQLSLLSANFPKVIDIGNYSFYKCINLKSISFPNATSIGLFAFKGCSSIISALFPLVTNIGSGAFNECTALSSIDFPLLKTIEALTFRYCESLITADFASVNNIKTQAFYASGLTNLILRSDTVCTLEDINAFSFTPIEEGTGYIYVPSELVESYKVANNWSAYANQILAIEE